MSTCLGLYIEENLIKYAKVSKDHDQVKVESFGVKFYENIDQTIKQIVEETYSYKTPISINLSEEMYNYFQVFALLNKKDLPKAINTEFESYCADKNYNPNVFETRYAITPNTQDKDKLKVIHVSENKIELNKILQKFASYKLQNVMPVSMSIPSVTELDKKENALIVNIEENTTITTIIDQNIYNITKIDIGSKEILDKINVKENSYQKAYEICKETTIYTSEGKELTDTEANYLEDIMPTLYEIVGQIRKVMNESLDKIDKVYITGTGALINNVDLYFEEYLEDVRCEILKPNFIKLSPDLNIKDYVEVNSAISLALCGLGQGISGMNFKKNSLMDKLPELLTIEVGTKKSQVGRKNPPKMLTVDFGEPLDRIEKNMLRSLSGLVLILVVYCGFSILIKNQIEVKNKEADESIKSTTAQISLVSQDIQSLQNKTNEYTNKINNLNQLNQEIEENNKTKKAIPNLLNRLMYVMPSEVQLTSIQNSTSTHIVIQAQSTSYAQLGYLTASIKTNGILQNVISTSGQKENNLVTIKIEGDLP
ncbi:type IV pilus assembly protein PilM [Clostridium sp. CAG:389]|nr:type IV pilus assembly protein PilM [Clostridium sp. CAG:389]